jgi:hypothetical protein
MSEFDPKVTEGLERVIGLIGQEFPELRAILDSGKRGELSENEAMAEMMGLIRTHPEMSVKLMDAMKDAFLPARQESGLAPVPQMNLSEVGDEAFYSGVGRPQMNPLMEAALAERAQFDGDMPELRTGPILPGVMPAVPVSTMARNPAAIGHQLQAASVKVREALDEADRRKALAIERVAEANKQTLALAEKASTDLVAMARGTAEDDPPEYRRGELPVPMAVQGPSGGELALMTTAERKEHAWRFLSTSQGRRTAVEVLRGMIARQLDKAGFPVRLREYDPRQQSMPLAFHEWKVNLSGRSSMQPAFNVIDTAGKAISRALERRARLEDPLPEVLYLEVVPVDTVDIRAVGWAARLIAA